MVCGIDEAGRGPLAGPVSAGALILGPDFPIEILKDSKKLSPRKREEVFKVILNESRFWGIGWASPSEIDSHNILRASLLAMERAYAALPLESSFLPSDIIVDGNILPEISGPLRAVVKADATVPEVMAASILAKVARDRVMARWDWIYPEYGYASHKGYPTPAHRLALVQHGPSPIQRQSFSWRPPAGF